MPAVVLAVLVSVLAAAPARADNAAHPVVDFETSAGRIVIELLVDAAPITTANFLDYVNAGFYDGTVFHRVIPGFVVQGGGYGPDLGRKATRAPIRNEADNGLENTRGTLSMARTQDPNSATSQFFINLSDNAYLDHHAPTLQGWGYAVFARVKDGMDVVDRIAAVETGVVDGMPDVPLTPVVVLHATVRPGS
jgi:cyclophilin family peptidyl-prolyl cis-trans isomerase